MNCFGSWRLPIRHVLRSNVTTRFLSQAHQERPTIRNRVKKVKPQLANMGWSLLALLLGGQVIYYSEQRKMAENEVKQLKEKQRTLGNTLKEDVVGPQATWMKPLLARFDVETSVLNQNIVANEVEKAIDQFLCKYDHDIADEIENPDAKSQSASDGHPKKLKLQLSPSETALATTSGNKASMV
mmetsp:Transcript_5964/g.7804  ORF Transcript_5964/g.7804 Transcript_5964/m.7804 type:complete len:184 (+) Transcript_5964:116-667(+)